VEVVAVDAGLRDRNAMRVVGIGILSRVRVEGAEGINKATEGTCELGKCFKTLRVTMGVGRGRTRGKEGGEAVIVKGGGDVVSIKHQVDISNVRGDREAARDHVIGIRLGGTTISMHDNNKGRARVDGDTDSKVAAIRVTRQDHTSAKAVTSQ
jgi:hypothetical protein